MGYKTNKGNLISAHLGLQCFSQVTWSNLKKWGYKTSHFVGIQKGDMFINGYEWWSTQKYNIYICFSETGDWHHLMEVSTGTGLKRTRVTYFPTNPIDWWMVTTASQVYFQSFCHGGIGWDLTEHYSIPFGRVRSPAMNKERKTLAVTSIFSGKTILKPLEAWFFQIVG